MPRPFIDKASARTFNLVHRSRRDPQYGGGDGDDDKVLREVQSRPNRGETRSDLEKRLGYEEDEVEEGDDDLFLDDGYDYMQHLRTVGDDDRGGINETTVLLEAPRAVSRKSKLALDLPKEALPSDQLLDYDKVIAQDQVVFDPHLDPRVREVLEALEDDAYVENRPMDEDENEDDEDEDFWQGLMAGGRDDGQQTQGTTKRHKTSASDDFSDDGRTELTGLSMSSSAMHRNPQLSALDDRFDRLDALYEDEEDEDEDEDALQGQDAELPMDEGQLDAIYDEFLDKFEIVGRRMRPILGGQSSTSKLEALRKELGQLEIRDVQSHSIEPLEERSLESGPDHQWDVETIMSTYSNLENRPKKIMVNAGPTKIRLNPRTGMPVVSGRSRPRKMTDLADLSLEGPETSSDSEGSTNGASKTTLARERGETREQKRARKTAQKEAKRERRSVKRDTKESFKAERKHRQPERARQEIVSLS